ncbi:MAG: septum formation protein Maf [Desulfovibrio sp.]|nr:septum formation protein Maf [Desulfovibrio sp.]
MHPIFTLPPDVTLVLASASPRRKALLEASWGVALTILPSPVDEPKPSMAESAEHYTRQTSAQKAMATAQRLSKTSRCIILGADTVVHTQNGTILGKPVDCDDALAMLQSLIGTWHSVTTSVTIILQNPPSTTTLTQTTRVHFGTFSSDVLKAYVNTLEPMDKAGAYAIQGKGAFLLKEIEGSWTNVVGLPLEMLTQWLCERNLLLPARPQ